MSTISEKKAKNETDFIDAEKRDFMKKFGNYAIAGAGMSILMNPTDSSACNYGGHHHGGHHHGGHHHWWVP